MELNKYPKKKKTFKYLKDIGNILDDGFILADNFGKVLIANQSAQELFGNNLMNKSIFKLINNKILFLSILINLIKNLIILLFMN